jgi:hypothetical protein
MQCGAPPLTSTNHTTFGPNQKFEPHLTLSHFLSHQQPPYLNFHLHVLASRYFRSLNHAFTLTSRNRFPLISLPLHSGEAKLRWESLGGVVEQFQGIEKKLNFFLVKAIPKCPWPGKPFKYHAIQCIP